MSALLLRNARLGDAIVDVSVDGGVITAVAAPGSPQAGALESIDLEGRWLSPGLWDSHVHFTQWALNSRRLDLSGATSAAHAAAMVAPAVAASTDDPALPFVGGAFRDGLWPDAPTVELLDAASLTRPVVLLSGDLHTVWLNSAALERFGHRGHPTGVLREDPAFVVTGQLGDVPVATLDDWASEAGAVAASRGVVGIVDLEMAWNRGEWERREQGGFDALRVEYGIYTEHLERAIAEGLHTGLATGALARVGSYKVLTDGSLNTRTAYCYDPYPGTDTRGMLTVPPEQLVPLMRRAASAGILPAVHAIGDHANTLALDAFEAVGCRGRIEHAQLLKPADVPRFAALGVAASVQPDHAMDDRDVADHHWAGRTGRAFPLRELLDSGAQLLLGSDAPVSPLDPWRSMAAAVTRSRAGREPWHPEQTITPGEALAASVRTSVRVGDPADLVVTEADPRVAEALDGMAVSLTLLGGRPTWRSGI